MKFWAKIEYFADSYLIKPLFGSDLDVLKKVPKNVEVEIVVKKKRNYEFHKKAMALFNLGFENQEKINSFDHYRRYTTIKAGFYIAYQMDTGVYYEPKSISFANMDDTEFSELYEKVLTEICKQLDTSKEEVRNELLKFM